MSGRDNRWLNLSLTTKLSCVCVCLGLVWEVNWLAHTKQWRFDPITISNLQVTILTIGRFVNVDIGDVEDNLLAVGCGDTPLAELTFWWWRRWRIVWRDNCSGSVLNCSTTFCQMGLNKTNDLQLLTWTSVEEFRLGNVAFAQPKPLANLWSHFHHRILFWQNRI